MIAWILGCMLTFIKAILGFFFCIIAISILALIIGIIGAIIEDKKTSYDWNKIDNNATKH